MEHMNRIIVITGQHVWSLGSKKGASSFYHTLKGYTDRGYQIELITCNSTDGLDLPGIREHHYSFIFLAKLSNIPKIGFGVRIIKSFLFQVYAFLMGLRINHERKQNLIYAYEIHGVLAAKLLGKWLGLPVVTRFQGTVMKPRMGTRLWRFRFWEHWLALRTHANLVIMANDGTQGDEVLHALGVPQDSVRFWVNGVDVQPEKPSKSEIDAIRKKLNFTPDLQILVTVSRLVSWKRLDRIITAMPAIVRQKPTVRLLVVGDGDGRADYENLARNLKIEEYVIFSGAISHGDVVKYMSLADIFVSLYDLSNVGNPLLEAMTLGKCIVTLNNGGTSSIIKHDINGVLLNPEELDRLPDVIITLLDDQTRRNRLGEAAQINARNSFWTWADRMKREISEVENLFGKRCDIGL